MKQKKILVNVLVVNLALGLFLNSCEKSEHTDEHFTDTRDTKTYKIVQIGDQIWMAENLKYAAGDGCFILNESRDYYYIWSTACDACPPGWHLPSDYEWKQLEIHLGMNPDAADRSGFRGTDEGSKLKTTSGWMSNGNGTNTTGFNAYPEGTYDWANSNIIDYSRTAGFWTSSFDYDRYAWVRFLRYDKESIERNGASIGYGRSVRCVKN